METNASDILGRHARIYGLIPVVLVLFGLVKGWAGVYLIWVWIDVLTPQYSWTDLKVDIWLGSIIDVFVAMPIAIYGAYALYKGWRSGWIAALLSTASFLAKPLLHMAESEHGTQGIGMFPMLCMVAVLVLVVTTMVLLLTRHFTQRFTLTPTEKVLLGVAFLALVR